MILVLQFCHYDKIAALFLFYSPTIFLKFFQTAASLYFSSEVDGTYNVAVSSMPKAPEHNGGSGFRQCIFVRLVHESNIFSEKTYFHVCIKYILSVHNL